MTKTIFIRSLFVAVALTTASLASNARAGVGDVYETNEGNLLRFRGGVGTPVTFTPGFTNPKGLVFDGNGRLYVADAGKNAILIISIPDGQVSTFVSALSSPIGLAFDTAGNLYEADSGSGTIFRFTPPDTTKTLFAAAVGTPAGLAFDATGNLFSADFAGGRILKIPPNGTPSVFASGLSFPAGLAFDSAGNLFAADSGSGSIFKFAPDGTRTTFASNAGRPYGLAFTAAGNLVVADNDNGGTFLYTPDGGKNIIFQSDFNTPQFVAVEPAQNRLLNISARGFVRGGSDVLIAGFVVGGNGPVGTSVLVRVLGPSLASFGITDSMADPVVELRNASGTLLASNNNWKDTQQAAIFATTLAPPDDRESAILIPLHGGAFTAVVSSATGETGTVVVEVYNLQ